VAGGEDYLELSVSGLLDALAAPTPAPAGGSAAALAVAMAASLAAMAARLSERHWEGAAGAAAEADTLRARVAPLARADADAYGRVLEAFRMPEGGGAEARDAAIGEALGEAAAVPLAVAAVAADVAALAAEIAGRGNPNLRGDAAAAAALADAGARIAAHLVAINVGVGGGDERVTLARKLAEGAAERAGEAFAAAR